MQTNNTDPAVAPATPSPGPIGWTSHGLRVTMAVDRIYRCGYEYSIHRAGDDGECLAAGWILGDEARARSAIESWVGELAK